MCENCAQLIPLQEQLSLNAHLSTAFPTEKGRAHASKQYEESCKKIQAFEERTGKKTLTSQINTMEDGKLKAQELGKDPKKSKF